MTMADNICECCGRKATAERPIIGVAGSGVAPISIAWCNTCIQIGAEPAGLMLAVCDPEETGKIDKQKWKYSFLTTMVWNRKDQKYQLFADWYDWFFKLTDDEKERYIQIKEGEK